MTKAAISKWHRAGFSSNQIALIAKSIEDARKEIYEDCLRKSIISMLAFPLNVMIGDYWKDEEEAHKEAPKFVEAIMSLYDSYAKASIDYNELNDLIYEYSGIKFGADFLNEEK